MPLQSVPLHFIATVYEHKLQWRMGCHTYEAAMNASLLCIRCGGLVFSVVLMVVVFVFFVKWVFVGVVLVVVFSNAVFIAMI